MFRQKNNCIDQDMYQMLKWQRIKKPNKNIKT